jgi:hypothetical protein
MVADVVGLPRPQLKLTVESVCVTAVPESWLVAK